MRSQAAKHLGRRCASGLGLLVVALCLPGLAQASCGQHVSTSAATHVSPSDSIPVLPGSPCTGPHCSSSPSQSLPLTVPVAGPQVEQSLACTTVPLSEPPRNSAVLPKWDVDPPARLAGTIFHPPRP
jgi:hypothetical protein